MAWDSEPRRARLLLLRRQLFTTRDASTRHLLRRWHSVLVVDAVRRTLGEVELAQVQARAQRHAHGATTLLALVESRRVALLTRGLGRWLRASLALVCESVEVAGAEISALVPEVKRGRERELALSARVDRLQGELHAVQSHASQQISSQREEADEVARAAAVECARMRSAVGEARSVMADDHRALLHWCGARVLVAFLTTDSMANKSQAFTSWRRTAESLSDDDLWRPIGSAGSSRLSASRPPSALAGGDAAAAAAAATGGAPADDASPARRWWGLTS